MITSTSSVDEPVITQSPSNYPKPHHPDKQEPPSTYYRSVQTTQDKRSRLSNVINSLYRKVPPNDRNSVERNLETLEKYVMTVLNGVIKDAETERTDESIKTDDNGYNNSTNESRIIDDDVKQINCLSTEASAVEPAIPSLSLGQSGESENTEKDEVKIEDERKHMTSSSSVVPIDVEMTSIQVATETIDSNPEIQSSSECSLDHSPDNTAEKIPTICCELLTDILNEISQTMDEQPTPSNTSLQCSLPLDKVAPVLNINDSTSHSSKSTVRHLCLYCDRKFLSISLRQRHTERVHQIGGGRRSDRNSRKTNCQYCSEKCSDNLDGLFHHMIVCHTDKYHGCILCTTRYPSKEALVAHTNDTHPNERNNIGHSCSNECDTSDGFKETVKRDTRTQIKMFTQLKLNILPRDDVKDMSGQDFDSSFYNHVSCNIRENLLHHLDGKLHPSANSLAGCYQANFYEPTQVQCSIDISLTAATPVDNKDYTTGDTENSSEYAQKPGKVSSCHPRRVSFEKYNFPKKYDGKEPWTGIGDLSKFDISTQLTLRKKQQLLKDKLLTLESIKCDVNSEIPSDVIKDSDDCGVSEVKNFIDEKDFNATDENNVSTTQFTKEFANFIRLKRWDDSPGGSVKDEKIVYAELTGEWSRPRVYICGACSSKHQTLKDLEEHKVISHPNVWCSHLEFSGDQTELDKHLVLPGRGVAIMKAKDAILSEKVCTKCLKTCGSLSELHKHMLECGGDQTWLLGLFGNGKKKCKWRPFGSRRKRQRGMKRNIQNSQDSKNQVNKTPKEKTPSGPRIRPSDRESIEKMLANLPAKRSTRKVTQELNLRSQGHLCKIQTRSKQRGMEITSTSRLSRKAVLRNKLIKNAKSFQRKRCRGDNISAAIESVISNYDVNSRRNRLNDNIRVSSLNGNERIYKNVTVVSKRRNIKMQGKSSMKSLKNRKTSSIKAATIEPKITRSNTQNKNQEVNVPVRRRRKPADPQASMKAKSQLRSNDGKFARNPVKNDPTSLDTQLSSSSHSSSTQITRSCSTRLAPKSKFRERINVGLARRITRVSSDVDKMPTLEPADKLTSHQVESAKSPNELPLLVPASKVTGRMQSRTKGMVGIKKRGKGRALANNIDKAKQDLEEKHQEAAEDVKIPRRKNKKSQEVQKPDNESENAPESDPPNKRVKSSTRPPNKTSRSNSLVKKGDTTRIRRGRRSSLEDVLKSTVSSFEALTTPSVEIKTPIGKIKDTSKQSNQKTVKPRNIKGKRKLQTESANEKRDVSATRKSPRYLEKKSPPNVDDPPNLEVVSNEGESKAPPEPLLPPPQTETSKLVDNATPAVVNEPIVAPDSPQLPQPSPDRHHESETLEKPEEVVEKIDEIPEKLDEAPESDENPPEKENEIELECELIEKQSSPIELVNDLVSLSFEHLQQESSNSNIDSGKENSSETPINITKSKIPKPKKVRGRKRDGQSKRTLNNVIGILTEGVNIPIEVQQSVVLTVQTSIESINLQSHNGNIQSEVSRVELGDNNVASGASNSINVNSTSGEANLSVDSVNKENNDGDSGAIEGLGEKPCQEASTPSGDVQSSDSQIKTNNSSNNAPAGTNTVEQFSNDIILDLSRRKQNGKGSFLEKIVSKIAKQKDVLLDNDVGSLLDHAVDELSIILDDVGPKSVENEVDGELKSPKSPPRAEALPQSNECKIENVESAKESETKILEISISDKIAESSKVDENIPSAPPPVNNIPALQSINQDESREIERTSKKRSSDGTLPIKNKRKTVNEEEVPDAKIEDELYLTDIMKLINSPPKRTSTPIKCPDTTDEMRTGKRKISDTEVDKSSETTNGDSSVESDPYATVGSKKSRRNQRGVRKLDKSIPVNNRGRRSNRTNTSVNNSRNMRVETGECEVVREEDKLSLESPLDVDKVPEDLVLLNKLLKIDEPLEVEKSALNNSETVAVALEELKNKEIVQETVPEKPIKSKRRGAAKKKSLADEHLDLSDDEIKSGESLTSKTEVNLEDKDGDKSRVNTGDQLEDKSSSGMNNSVKSFFEKITPDVTNDSSSATIEGTVRYLSPVIHREQKSSKRRSNHEKAEVLYTEVAEKVNDAPVQRRQTLRRKAKENIFLIEELLDFGDDIDSPSDVDRVKEDEKNACVVNEDKEAEGEAVVGPLEETIREANVAEVLTDVKEVKSLKSEEALTEDVSKTNKDITEQNPQVPGKNDPITTEPVIEDETQSPKKRVSGNFAVVHTKSGEILIVEKKKKFTKEAARFFCDVCATSFTRKSSLKKHNLSQSHILQVSKCCNEQESLSLIEKVTSEVKSLEDSFLHDENPNGKVSGCDVVETRAEDVVPEVPLANSTIDTIETAAKPELFNSQLEEELLDEEICKITQNMTHDDYVLTDHISPEGVKTETTKKEVNDPETLENFESKQKVNLADEHLQLESPRFTHQEAQGEDKVVVPALIIEEIVPSTGVISPTLENSKISLDFSNITEKLKGKNFLESEQKTSSTSFEDIKSLQEEKPQSEIDLNNSKPVEDMKINTPIFDSAKKSKFTPEKSPKKSKNRNKRSKKKSIAELVLSHSEDDSDTENVKSQDKNKIVKSVFGRAFTGEKLDKVMEVLDDWNSKSESDSHDDKPDKNKPVREIKDKGSDKTERVRKSNKQSESFSLEINSRCRQSKKRAEERISRAFEEESIPYHLTFDSPEKELGVKNKIGELPGESPGNKDPKAKFKSKKSPEGVYHDEGNKEVSSPVSTFPSTLKRKIMNEEGSLQDTNSMESIHTRVPSCPRERSSTPDLISVTTRDSYNEGDDFMDGGNDDDDEDEHMSMRGRLSPFYASNAPESSMNSGTMSTSNHLNNDGFVETRRGNSTEFSGEKIVIRSPVLSSQESCPGVVTIAPTDAIEDNALDVPQEIVEMKEKPGIPRQGKVLNFDEELFVECCSRLKATTENELRGAKKIKLDPTDDYQSRDENTQQSSQGPRQVPDRWRDVESQNSLGSLLESVNQLLGEEMYNSNRRGDSHKRRNDHRERVSPPRTPQTDFIRPDNISYEDSLDVAFEHNNKLRDKIQQRMRESENMIATSFGQKVTSRNYRQYYDPQPDKASTEKVKLQEDNFSMNYSSKHIPLESLPIKNKMNPSMDGFLDEALSNILHRNGKHDHNGSTPMNVLAELACAQVPTSTTPSTPTPLEKPVRVPSAHSPHKDPPKKPRNPIRELFERKKELNDRKRPPVPPRQRSKKSKHQTNSPLIRKSQFGIGLAERKKRHNDKKSEIIGTKHQKQVKDVYDFDEEDSGEAKFSVKSSYRSQSERPTDSIVNNMKNSSDINVNDLMSKTIAKTLDNGKTTESADKRLDKMIDRKFQDSDLFLPKTKGALKSFTQEERNQREKIGPMDNFVERKHHRSRRSTECSGKTTKKRKSKGSKKRSRNAWYEDDSSDEFVTAVKADSVGVGITKSQRTCSKGKQNLFAEMSSTSSESEQEELEEKTAEADDAKTLEISEWMDGVKAGSGDVDDSEKIESDSPLVIDEKDSDGENNSDDENRSERGFELDDLYREGSSVASSDSEEEAPKVLEENVEEVENKKFEDSELIPLDEALVLLDSAQKIEEKTDLDDGRENAEKVETAVDVPTEDLPEKLSSNEKPKEKASENLPLHVFLSRKVQESKKKKEEKLKKLQEKERERIREQEELAADEGDRGKDQLVEFQSTRRQRKCAIGKQGLLAEISSSDEEFYYRDGERRGNERADEKSKRQKRESKEKRKERYMEKKHELMIAKEQKAIEEEILREVKMKRGGEEGARSSEDTEGCNQAPEDKGKKERTKSLGHEGRKDENRGKKNGTSDTENKCNKFERKSNGNRRKEEHTKDTSSVRNDKGDKEEVTPDGSKNCKKSRRSTKPGSRRNKSNGEARRSSKERRSTSGKRDSDDEELRTTKSWNKVDEAVGVAIGRRKRAAANQLYYWSSSTDDDEDVVPVGPVVEEEDDRQEQHGWIVGDSHKKMITMLAMEKQLKEKRRRSEDEFESGKMKNKKHRNSTS
ncbi:microtubule-associated protein futsch-like isoform X2 [Diachasmimorpha longicaudata]